MMETHISNIPFVNLSVHRNLAGFVSYDPDGGVETIATALAARGGRMDQRILSGEEFAEYDQNTRALGVYHGLSRCGEI